MEIQNNQTNIDLLKKAFRLLVTAKSLAELYEDEKATTGKYVHATSRGHEAIQIATGLQLTPQDYLSAYYRDDAMLLAIGITPYELMLQLLAKRDDIFSGGRTYYSHPSLNHPNYPKIPHQSSATGMQAIPTTGVAMGIQYAQKMGIIKDEKPIAVCSLGDACCTEGEVSEALQMAVLKSLPILYLVQDNEWDISASADEIRAQDMAHFAKGFKGLEVFSIDGTNFLESYETIEKAISIIRKENRPVLVHAKVPLLNHHTSGVRKEWYRDDLVEAQARDPYDRLKEELYQNDFSADEVENIESEIRELVYSDYQKAKVAEDPRSEDLYDHVFAPTPITEEKGNREPIGKHKTVMVDSALFAIREIMDKHPESLLYGQDVGIRLGGVFREAATLASQFGQHRVFNTPIQEAFIIGSTVGMSVVGLKPIVEVQFADYIWPGLNQLFTEVARSNYLSNGKWPISMILRVPIGAYGSGGPYHSSSVESVLTSIKGIKIAYPSTGADLKGLMKAAYYDPNPVVMLEHKGLYWSKMKGTEDAATIEPDEDYVLPFGKARIVQDAPISSNKNTITIVTYGMGVYWAKEAAKNFDNQVEIIDLRTLVPLDENAIFESVKKHGRCIVLTEEQVSNSFAQAIGGLISENCFEYLDAPVRILGAKDMPAIPLNSNLEQEMLPNAKKLHELINSLLSY
ncbi:alpha-ketoacid dehydrogenase subunit alpha/beta [Faecalibacter rhinopitheci]|uniref:3-methyl-2-oxobutanoate dehydrogenase (2-methylpropanoyl-transferring) n=1 Tax=Faecalibacter rhinopitheci TaxID=2779678 RepID=A0A8J7FQE8_9FLAO|nr:alpha-ketoacid dehydrogenase subunit alpha/beta [Faecalibacter rhinopitheci]MBF0595962.1 tungsten formylmethanofuran dehydrogenase [Faecalibacter rhinopitheci]